jgi:hypothetical protein
MSVVQHVKFNKYSAISCRHPIAMMVEFFGSSGSEGCSGPALGGKPMTDEILDVAYMVLCSHGRMR